MALLGIKIKKNSKKQLPKIDVKKELAKLPKSELVKALLELSKDE